MEISSEETDVQYVHSVCTLQCLFVFLYFSHPTPFLF